MARKTDLRETVRNILKDELQGMLEDVRYRLSLLDDMAGGVPRFGSRHLNLSKHQLDGYVVTDNTPVAGSISWSDVNIVYKGTNYAIVPGNTANKYVWWDFSATDKTLLLTSNTKPVLEEDDVLVFVNDAGIHATVVGKMTHGLSLVDGSVNTGEIANSAISAAKILASTITSTQLADNAVIAAKITAGAVVAGKLATDAVASGNIAAGAVISGKLGTNAVVAANITDGAVTSLKMPTGAVGATQLATDAVTGVKIAAGAVVAGKLGTDAVVATNIAANAVTGAKIADNVITGAKLVDASITGVKVQDGAITGVKIGAGSVATDRLNTALHMIF